MDRWKLEFSDCPQIKNSVRCVDMWLYILTLSYAYLVAQSAKDEIDTGVFEGCADVHILANLVKV